LTLFQQKHKAQVTSLDMAYDGMLGVSGSLDRHVYIWDLSSGDCLRELSMTSFVVRVAMSCMGKFICINLLDGSNMIYECLTTITWKTEKLSGKHSAVALSTNNFLYEVAREGIEHKLIEMFAKKKQRFHEEFIDARPGIQHSSSLKEENKRKSQSERNVSNRSGNKSVRKLDSEMQIVPEVDTD